jgi:hypothetical protein
LLGPTVVAAAVLAVFALVLWAVALWVSWGGECPNSSPRSGGLDKGISVWPPAARCLDPHGNSFWHQALPWAPWAIGVLVLAAAAILLTGLVVAIRDLRRPAAVGPPRSLATLGALPPAQPPRGQHCASKEAASADRDPPAMAA